MRIAVEGPPIGGARSFLVALGWGPWNAWTPLVSRDVVLEDEALTIEHGDRGPYWRMLSRAGRDGAFTLRAARRR